MFLVHDDDLEKFARMYAYDNTVSRSPGRAMRHCIDTYF